MFKITQKGDFGELTDFLEDCLEIMDHDILTKYGEMGVRQLEQATPRDTGETAFSWYYEIVEEKGRTSLEFHNRNTNNDALNQVNVAIILQYGHADKNGAWVEGIDYMNPVLDSIFQDLAYKIWEEVIK